MYPTAIDLSENGQEFNLVQGQEFSISLTDNPSTGYVWNIVDLDEDQLTLIDHNRIFNEENRIGQQSTQVFKLLAKSSGTTILKIQLARSWQPTRILNHFFITLNIT